MEMARYIERGSAIFASSAVRQLPWEIPVNRDVPPTSEP